MGDGFYAHRFAASVPGMLEGGGASREGSTPSDPPAELGQDAHTRPAVVAAVCTFRRNDQLRRLLEHLIVAASAAQHSCALGVVVVDDNRDGEARPVADEFAERFELGLQYRHSGLGNISAARNLGLDAARASSDWIVMTDDDCVPDERWLLELLATQRRTGADAVSGPLVRRAPADAPRWLVDQPFLEQGLNLYPPDASLGFASTHNSMLSTEWLRRHDDHRFEHALGELGGEDMFFYRSAHRRGLSITYAAEAVVYEDQPAERLSYRFMLRQALWLGNSSMVTSLESAEATRSRLVVHGLARVSRAAAHPLRRLRHGRSPQLRYSLAVAAGGVGVLLGTVGIRLRHH
jgi:glycosyltransferase involved in cell wall biosynthesis